MKSTTTASLLFCCSDQVGVIADLASYFSKRNLKVSRHEESIGEGKLFSRIEWILDDRWENEDKFCVEFDKLVDQYDATFTVRFDTNIQKIGLIVSKHTNALIDVLNKIEINYFPDTDISFIISDEKTTQNVADRYAIPFFYIPTAQDALDYEQQQLDIIQRYQPDFLGLTGYSKALSANFLKKVSCAIINTHQSFLPSFTGPTTYQSAYERGVKLIAATAYFVTAELGHGPIITQDVMRLETGASVKDMMKAGRDVGQRVFTQALIKTLQHKVMVYEKRTIVFN